MSIWALSKYTGDNRQDPALYRWFQDVSRLLGSDGYRYVTWTPTLTGLTEVGAVTKTGKYLRDRHMLHFQAELVGVSGGTFESTLGTTYINNLPHTAKQFAAGLVVNATTRGDVGRCVVDDETKRVYLPTFSATSDRLVICGSVMVEG